MNRPLALRGHVTNASFKQLAGIMLMPKIHRAHKNYMYLTHPTFESKAFKGDILLMALWFLNKVVWFVLDATLEGILLPSNCWRARVCQIDWLLKSTEVESAYSSRSCFREWSAVGGEKGRFCCLFLLFYGLMVGKYALVCAIAHILSGFALFTELMWVYRGVECNPLQVVDR